MPVHDLEPIVPVYRAFQADGTPEDIDALNAVLTDSRWTAQWVDDGHWQLTNEEGWLVDGTSTINRVWDNAEVLVAQQNTGTGELTLIGHYPDLATAELYYTFLT